LLYPFILGNVQFEVKLMNERNPMKINGLIGVARLHGHIYVIEDRDNKVIKMYYANIWGTFVPQILYLQLEVIGNFSQ
jgi:hypothetical protein